jgi:hypothetical protein
MFDKWVGLHGPITALAAECEPEAQRLFNGPVRPMSPETRALFARIDKQQEVRSVGTTQAPRRPSAERTAVVQAMGRDRG